MKKSTYALFWIGIILLGWAVRWYFDFLAVVEPSWEYWVGFHLSFPGLIGIVVSFLPGVLLIGLFWWPSRKVLAAKLRYFMRMQTFSMISLAAVLTSGTVVNTVQHGWQEHDIWGACFWFLAVLGNWLVVGGVFGLFALESEVQSINITTS